jgi:hypothetical protein
MLKNSTDLLQISSDTFRKVEYVFLVPIAKRIGKVEVAAILYSDEENFLNNADSGVVELGSFDFDIAQPLSLLEAAENFAISKIPTLEKCETPQYRISELPHVETTEVIETIEI